MADAATTRSLHGTVVLVHGTWGHPDDWQWVRAPLDDAGLDVIAIDLPSHRGVGAGLPDDAQHVRDVVARASTPVIGLGWSYGGTVLCEAIARGASLAHLVLLGSVPMPRAEVDDSWIDLDPHIEVLPDGRFRLDVSWWLDEEAGATMREEVRSAIRRTGRRAANRAIVTPFTGEEWQRVPATVIYGEDDFLVPPDEREWAAGRFDVRVVPGDHFVLFRTPEVVSDAVLEAARALQG